MWRGEKQRLRPSERYQRILKILLFTFLSTAVCFGQNVNIGFVNVDSVTMLSAFGNPSRQFCWEVDTLYARSRLFKDFLREYASLEIWTCSSRDVYLRQVDRLKHMQDSLLKLEALYKHRFHQLNDSLYQFTLAEIKAHLPHLIKKHKLTLVFNQSSSIFFVENPKTPAGKYFLSKELATRINKSSGLRERWIAWKTKMWNLCAFEE
jgi:hypothetical protein